MKPKNGIYTLTPKQALAAQRQPLINSDTGTMHQFDAMITVHCGSTHSSYLPFEVATSHYIS